MILTPDGVTITEVAPGVDLNHDILAQAKFPLRVSDALQVMEAALFRPEPIGLRLPPASRRLEFAP